MSSEPVEIALFRDWLATRGAYLHPSIRFVKDSSGMSVYTTEELPADTKIVSCPFSLAVTPSLAKNALATITELRTELLETLSERELICTYLVFHWIFAEGEGQTELKSATAFEHLPYLHTLPPSEALRTALHFNDRELSLLRGTNLFGATVDRKAERKAEWMRCCAFVGVEWSKKFTWQRYLTASTYLSSRAFPSTLLSKTPSLVSTKFSYPILLPGVDTLNHARAHRVSWLVGDAEAQTPLIGSQALNDSESHSQVSLVVHVPSPVNTEIFNNYGPKPNSELILGYGFCLPSNPDDTIVLKISGRGGTGGERWEIGRNASGAEGLWQELRVLLENADEEEAPSEWELELEAAGTLRDMVESKLGALPELPISEPDGVRSDVWNMVQHYVRGQRDILESLLAFSETKEEGAFAKAKEAGAEWVFEEQDEDMP